MIGAKRTDSSSCKRKEPSQARARGRGGRWVGRHVKEKSTTGEDILLEKSKAKPGCGGGGGAGEGDRAKEV